MGGIARAAQVCDHFFVDLIGARLDRAQLPAAADDVGDALLRHAVFPQRGKDHILSRGPLVDYAAGKLFPAAVRGRRFQHGRLVVKDSDLGRGRAGVDNKNPVHMHPSPQPLVC